MIRKKAAEGRETSYFHSRIFIRLFLSYALIIAVFLALYVGMYLTACSTYYRSAAEREHCSHWGTGSENTFHASASSTGTSSACRAMARNSPRVTLASGWKHR